MLVFCTIELGWKTVMRRRPVQISNFTLRITHLSHVLLSCNNCTVVPPMGFFVSPKLAVQEPIKHFFVSNTSIRSSGGPALNKNADRVRRGCVVGLGMILLFTFYVAKEIAV